MLSTALLLCAIGRVMGAGCSPAVTELFASLRFVGAAVAATNRVGIIHSLVCYRSRTSYSPKEKKENLCCLPSYKTKCNCVFQPALRFLVSFFVFWSLPGNTTDALCFRLRNCRMIVVLG